MKRLIIYVYSDESGAVGDATGHLLEGLRKIADRLVIVCNSFLSPRGRKSLWRITKDVYCLNCKNMTEVAYADALENYCGFQEVLEYDEVTLIDGVVWGPLCPLDDIWREMEERECDYWRLASSVPTGEFVVLRRSFLERGVFQEYLDDLLVIYQKTFQNIGKKKKYLESDHLPNIYEGMKEANYLEENSVMEISELERKLGLLATGRYPFLEKKLLNLPCYEFMKQREAKKDFSVLVSLCRGDSWDLESALLEQEECRYLPGDVQNRESMRTGKLYLDYGEGYQEIHTVKGYNAFNVSGDFRVRFAVSAKDKIFRFRYDPLEGLPYLGITIDRCACDGEEVRPSCNNGKDWGENYQVFTSTDPYYEFEFEADTLGEVVIEGNMLLVNRRFIENMDSCRTTQYFSRIFWDTGAGYDEGHKATEYLFLDMVGNFELRFSCDVEGVRELRFDPVEGVKTRIRLDEIKINDKETPVKKTNGVKCADRQWEFPHYDPIILLGLKEKTVRSVYVRGNIQFIQADRSTGR